MHRPPAKNVQAAARELIRPCGQGARSAVRGLATSKRSVGDAIEGHGGAAGGNHGRARSGRTCPQVGKRRPGGQEHRKNRKRQRKEQSGENLIISPQVRTSSPTAEHHYSAITSVVESVAASMPGGSQRVLPSVCGQCGAGRARGPRRSLPDPRCLSASCRSRAHAGQIDSRRRELTPQHVLESRSG